MDVIARPKWYLKQTYSHQTFEIRVELRVGRKHDAGICLDSLRCSKLHACFGINIDGHLSVEDLKSTNGVFVNGTRLCPFDRYRLFHGDIVTIGFPNPTEINDVRDKYSVFEVLMEVPAVPYYRSVTTHRVKQEPSEVIELDDTDDEVEDGGKNNLNDVIKTVGSPESDNECKITKVDPSPQPPLPSTPTPPPLPPPPPLSPIVIAPIQPSLTTSNVISSSTTSTSTEINLNKTINDNILVENNRTDSKDLTLIQTGSTNDKVIEQIKDSMGAIAKNGEIKKVQNRSRNSTELKAIEITADNKSKSDIVDNDDLFSQIDKFMAESINTTGNLNGNDSRQKSSCPVSTLNIFPNEKSTESKTSNNSISDSITTTDQVSNLRGRRSSTCSNNEKQLVINVEIEKNVEKAVQLRKSALPSKDDKQNHLDNATSSKPTQVDKETIKNSPQITNTNRKYASTLLPNTKESLRKNSNSKDDHSQLIEKHVANNKSPVKNKENSLTNEQISFKLPTTVNLSEDCELQEENGCFVLKSIGDMSQPNGINSKENRNVAHVTSAPFCNPPELTIDSEQTKSNTKKTSENENKPQAKEHCRVITDVLSSTNESPVYIDMTGDSDDDDDDLDMDIASSQIAQMTAKVKTEIEDECFKMLKEHCPDCYDSELEVNLPNAVNTTQDVYECLNDDESNSYDFWKKCNDDEQSSMEIDNIIKSSSNKEQPLVDSTTSNSSFKTKSASALNKKKEETSSSTKWLRKEDIELKRSTSSSRTDAPKEKKVRKNSMFTEAKCDSKSIKQELKKRHSTPSVRIDKSSREAIKKERRRKLKEITIQGTSTIANPEEAMDVNEATKNDCEEEEKDNNKDFKVKKTLQNTNRGEFLCDNIKATSSKTVTTTNRRKEQTAVTSSTKLLNNIKFKIPKVVSMSEKLQNNNTTTTLPSAVNGNKMSNIETTLDDIISENIRKEAALKMDLNIRMNHNIDCFDIIEKILNWLPKWLQIADFNPPINNPPATKIPLSFDTAQQYYDTFTKMLLLENWQYMYKEFRESNKGLKMAKLENLWFTSKELMYLECTHYLGEEDQRKGHFMRNDDVVLIEYRYKKTEKEKSILTFGLIKKSFKLKLTDTERIPLILAEACDGPPQTKAKYTIIIPGLIQGYTNLKSYIMIQSLLNTTVLLKQIRVIKQLFKSSLGPYVLDPDRKKFTFPITHKFISNFGTVNSKQKALITEAASLCTGESPGIYCLKGPPGTGKSFVIVHIVFQILSSYYLTSNNNDPPIILLAAPSNAAVDSLLSKLLKFKHNLSNYGKYNFQVKLVRVGPEHNLSAEAKSHSLGYLAAEYVPVYHQENVAFKKAKERKENMVEFSKRYFGKNYNNAIKTCEDIVLDKSNIICTTLTSCVHGRLIDAVNRRRIKFSCCIIDEATQCHEIDSILPILLGIEKFVLVGDPKQLNATVLSREASNLGFENSFLTRIANKFENEAKSPIGMLTNQYRMHKDICYFPSKQFYKGQLRTYVPHRDSLYDKIKPYLVFSCAPCEDSDDYTNTTEVKLIKGLLSAIFTVLGQNNVYSIGIITPYNAQRQLIHSSISELRSQNNQCKIKVNTVDSFQGSEEDIVIISCVRKSSNLFLQNENRLNVALTRARHALYIFGNDVLFQECVTLSLLKDDAKKRNVLIEIDRQYSQNMMGFDFEKHIKALK